jgi:hypothetical protein
LLVAASFPILAATIASAATAPLPYRVDWTRGCPPVGYLTPAQKAAVMAGTMVNPNPALDLDLANTGVNTAWNIPITLKKSSDGTAYTTTDENGANKGTIFLPAIPDPAGRGFGSDHYSPRFRRANVDPAQGNIIGECVYTMGRNLWTLDFADANNNGKPDQFLKSQWRSRNGDPTDANFNQMTFFTTDLTKGKIEFVRTVETPAPAPGKTPGKTSFGGYSIEDAVISNLGTDPSSVMLGGRPIGLPGPSPANENIQQAQDDVSALSGVNSLIDNDAPLLPGQGFTVHGLIQNSDDESHQYSFSLFGVNATLDGVLAPITLAPGAVRSYDLQATVTGQGDVGLFSLAYSETGLAGDGMLASAVFQSVPEPGCAALALPALFALCSRRSRRR